MSTHHSTQKTTGRRKDPRPEPLATDARTCSLCKEIKTYADFPKAGDGWRSLCKDCYNGTRFIPNYDPHTTQTCDVCQEPKRLREFTPRRGTLDSTCKGCLAQRPVFQSRQSRKVIPLPTNGNVLLVNADQRQVLVCQVLSEIPGGAKRLDNLIAAFKTRGLRVIDVTERTDSEASS